MTVKQLTTAQVETFLATDATRVLIDVRELHELKNGMIDGAISIPMNEVAAAVSDLTSQKDKPLILICRTGNRSNQVGGFLVEQGFTDVVNLVGGMNAWAVNVDTTMTVY